MVQAQDGESDIMHDQEPWDTLYHRKHQEQREGRGARDRYQQLRQEIADAAIAMIDNHGMASTLTSYGYLDQLVGELRALEQQYPSVKEEM
jgi:hypothetical protein